MTYGGLRKSGVVIFEKDRWSTLPGKERRALLKISACVIVKNEEVNIIKWLENMKKIADEMIVVDTGSCDKTVFLAQQAGAKVYFYQWQDDFAGAKNFAMEQALGDWIIFLDADERFSTASIENVRRVIMREHLHVETVDAIMCSIINIDVDQNNIELGRFLNVRLFRNSPELGYRGKIHEELRHKKRAVRLLIEQTLEIYHTGYSTKRVQAKIKRNLKLLQADIREHGESEKHYRYLSDCYHALGAHAQAVKYAKLHLKSNVRSIGSESDIYRNLINSMIFLKQNEKDIEVYIKEAISKFSDIPDFYAYYAASFFRAKDFSQAKQYFFKALAIYKASRLKGINASSFMFVLTEVYGYLSDIFQREQDLPMAFYYVDLALQANKYNCQAFSQLYSLCEVYSYEKLEVCLKAYYLDSREDLIFIVQQLSDMELCSSYFYYADLLEKKYGIVSAKTKSYRLFARKDIAGFLTFIQKKWLSDLSMAVCIALNSTGDKKIKGETGLFPETFLYCLNRYLNDGLCLCENDVLVYENILLQAIAYGEKSLIEKLLLMGGDFPPETLKEIIQLLYQHQYWQEAKVLLTCHIEYFLEITDSSFLSQAAICLQYSNEPKLAKLFYSKLTESSNLNFAVVEGIDGETSLMEHYINSLLKDRYDEYALSGLYGCLRYEDPVEVLQILKALYQETEQDLEFVVSVLKKYSFDKVYLYYVNLFKKIDASKGGDISLQGMIASGNQNEAWSFLIKELKVDYTLLLVAGCLGKYIGTALNTEEYLPKLYKDVLCFYLEKGEGMLKNEGISIYGNLKIELEKAENMLGIQLFVEK